MIKILGIAVILTGLYINNIDAQSIKGENIMFNKVLIKLDEIIKPLEPKVQKDQENSSSLIISYRKRKFMVHPSLMTGERSEKAIEMDGPDYRGFILRLFLEPAGTINQAETPQTLIEPYWKTYLDVSIIKDTDKQFYWSLSYGNRTSKALIDSLIKAVKSVQE